MCLRTCLSKLERGVVMLTMLGNVLFLLGSMAFLDEAWETAGVWLFIVGSVFMVIDSYRQRQAMMVMQRQLEQAALATSITANSITNNSITTNSITANDLSGLTSEPY